MKTQFEENLLEEINEIKKILRKMTSSDVHDLSCLFSSVLPKWIKSKIFTINLILFWMGTGLPLYWTGGGQKAPNQVNSAIWYLTTM